MWFSLVPYGGLVGPAAAEAATTPSTFLALIASINAVQAAEMIASARNHQRFLMDAVWSRFQPVEVRLRELVAEGAITRDEARYHHGLPPIEREDWLEAC